MKNRLDALLCKKAFDFCFNFTSFLQSFVLVIPPPVYAGDQPGKFDAEDVTNLANDVTYFSLMTYDYSSPQRPGPNSPLPWVKKCIRMLDPDSVFNAKFLLGLNFYGNDYTPAGGGRLYFWTIF